MRFFCVACLFGVFVASLGLLTRNWTQPLFQDVYAQPASVISGHSFNAVSSDSDFSAIPALNQQRLEFDSVNRDPLANSNPVSLTSLAK